MGTGTENSDRTYETYWKQYYIIPILNWILKFHRLHKFIFVISAACVNGLTGFNVVSALKSEMYTVPTYDMIEFDTVRHH